MKSNIIMISIGCFLLATLAFMPLHAAAEDNPDETPAVISTVESGELDLLFADVSQEGGGGGINLSAAYAELRDLVKKYRKAKERVEKERIVTRAEELMGQLFDAKVQSEKRRVEALERKLAEDKRRLKDMQSHKRDLVKTATQRALENGEMPEWAPQREATSSE